MTIRAELIEAAAAECRQDPAIATAVIDAIIPLIADAIEADEALRVDVRCDVWEATGWSADDDAAMDTVHDIARQVTASAARLVRQLGQDGTE